MNTLDNLSDNILDNFQNSHGFMSSHTNCSIYLETTKEPFIKINQEFLKNLETSGSLITPCFSDELDWSFNLEDLDLSFLDEIISDTTSPITHSPVDETNLFPITNTAHQSNSTESSTSLPGVKEFMDVAMIWDFTTAKCKKVISIGNIDQAPPLVKEAFPPLLSEKRYRGVRLLQKGKFSAEMRNPEKKGTKLWLGTYGTAKEAAMAYDRAAFKHRGSHARLNFPYLVGFHDVSPEKYSVKKRLMNKECSSSSPSWETPRCNHRKRRKSTIV